MRNFVARRAEGIPHSGIREVFNIAAGMEDVVHFEIGDPCFGSPATVVEAAHLAASAGKTHYSANAGLQELRTRIAARLSREMGQAFDPEEVVVTAGSTEASLLALLSTVEEGDEILVPSPAWPNYLAQIMLAGGNPVAVKLRADSDFQPNAFDLARHISAKTKGLLLNYPHNPTGAVLSPNALREMARFAIEHDLLVYSDEAYASIVFEESAASILSLEGMRPRTVLLRSFSKEYAMTGWRVGYLVAETGIAQTATKLHEHTSACASSVSQHAALAALTLGSGEAEHMLEEYRTRRQVVIDGLERCPGAKLFRPRGTFYAFVNVSAFGLPSREIAEQLLRLGRVAVAPGSAFGAGGEGYIRICFAAPTAEVRRGISRIADVFAKLPLRGGTHPPTRHVSSDMPAT